MVRIIQLGESCEDDQKAEILPSAPLGYLPHHQDPMSQDLLKYFQA